MKSRITDVLGIKYPILQGGMAWCSDANLAAAVSRAGGAGIIGASSNTGEWLTGEIRKAKTLTQNPFGVNMTLMAVNYTEMMEVVLSEKVDFVTLSAGNPVPYIETYKKAGIKVIVVVPNVKIANRIEGTLADAMVIEGMEGGGHIGTQTTMALMSNVLPQVKLPVVVAGGISDGRAMAAALLMGASGVQMGSRFLLATESPAHKNMQDAIIKATDTDSAVTGFSRGHGVRGLKSAFTEKFLAMETSGVAQEELNKLAAGTYKRAAVDGDIINGMVQVGQSLNVLDSILPCADIIKQIMDECDKTLQGAAKIKIY